MEIYMQEKSKEILIAKNVFKGKTREMQKIGFNAHYERYINFCENKT